MRDVNVGVVAPNWLVLCMLRTLALRFIAAWGHVLRLHADLVNKAGMPRDKGKQDSPYFEIYPCFSLPVVTPCCCGF